MFLEENEACGVQSISELGVNLWGAGGPQCLGDFPVCAKLKAGTSLERGDAEDSAGCQDLQEVPEKARNCWNMAAWACSTQFLLLPAESASATRLPVLIIAA